MKNPKKTDLREENLISSLEEFKKIYFPKDAEKEIYSIKDPEELGKRIADENYENHKEALFSSNCKNRLD